jgi:hypothetical protein
MATQADCSDDPEQILRTKVCLTALSKDLEGELRPGEPEKQECREPSCNTLKNVQFLHLAVRFHRPCDSQLARSFDGEIIVERLVTAFGQDGEHRGFHAGDFRWSGAEIRAVGRMSGMTNEGNHRGPAFDDCQPCNALGVMEGRICGQVVDTHNEALTECRIFGSYRIKFDSSTAGGSGVVVGTLEGVIICPCN